MLFAAQFIPPALKSIRYRAIAINSIRTLEIPGSVDFIENEAFHETGLRAVTFGEGILTVERVYEPSDVMSVGFLFVYVCCNLSIY